jgi:hypothetical protein
MGIRISSDDWEYIFIDQAEMQGWITQQGTGIDQVPVQIIRAGEEIESGLAF